MNEEYNENLEYQEDEELSQETMDLETYLLQHQTLPSIAFDFNEVRDIQLDKIAYKSGVKLASYYAGIINTFKNFGLDNQGIMEFILNERTIEMNTRLTAMNNKNNIDVSKIQAVKIQNQEL